MGETKGILRYEVEIQKQLKKGEISLLVSVIRGPRGKTKTVGEATTRTPSQPYIWFRITNAKDEKGVFREFLRLLVHRGYLPLRVKELKDGVYSDWVPTDTTGIEGIDEVLAHEAKAEAVKASEH